VHLLEVVGAGRAHDVPAEGRKDGRRRAGRAGRAGRCGFAGGGGGGRDALHLRQQFLFGRSKAEGRRVRDCGLSRASTGDDKMSEQVDTFTARMILYLPTH
jgi:hypothetical protein